LGDPEKNGGSNHFEPWYGTDRWMKFQPPSLSVFLQLPVWSEDLVLAAQGMLQTPKKHELRQFPRELHQLTADHLVASS
jgi:hypothetical protein